MRFLDIVTLNLYFPPYPLLRDVEMSSVLLFCAVKIIVQIKIYLLVSLRRQQHLGLIMA